MRILNLEDLHIFRSVVREGGILRAASELNRVPSNVTTRIKQFEERLGAKLFRRQGRGLALTHAGQTLLGHAERLLRLADEAEQDLRHGVVCGVLRLGSLESAAGVRLPPLLSKYHADFPQTSIELQTGTTDALLRLVETYAIEAAFVSEPFDKGALSCTPFFNEELVLITALGAPAVRRAKDLVGQTLVAFPDGCSYRRRVQEWLAASGVTPARCMDLSSYHAIVACVAAGAGIAVVPAGVLDQVTLGKTVQRHPLPAPIRRNRTHLVWSGDASPALLALMALRADPAPNGDHR